MKNKFLLLSFFAVVAAFAFSLTSCGGDSDEPVSSASIVGTWKPTDYEGWGPESVYEEAKASFSYIYFQANGTYIEIEEDDEAALGFTITRGTWRENGNTLTLTFELFDEPFDFPYQIIKKTSNQLVLSALGIKFTCARVDNSVLNPYLAKENEAKAAE